MVFIMVGTLLDRPIARILMVLVCLYAPYAWLVLIDYPWDGYRWLWIKLWLVLPGILVPFIQPIHRLPDWMGFIIMGVVTCVIVALSTVLAARSKGSAIIVSIIVGLLSCANSWISYRLFLL
jgi:hypothetical protein